MMSFIKEFKAFAMRGNVMDMAVGIILGAAFGQIVSSLVSDVVMPPIGVLIGGVDFSDLAFTIKAAEGAKPAVILSYGKFIQAVINFLIIAFSVFIMVKIVNRLLDEHKKAEEVKVPELTTQEQLLTEIRDLLKTPK